MTLVKFKNRNDVLPFSNFIDTFFGREFSPDFFNDSSSMVPAVNIREMKDKFMVDVAAPGLTKEDFKLNVDNDMLTISAEKEAKTEKEEANYSRKEFSYHSFRRSFTMPEYVNIDKIAASYNEGVLTITLPKVKEVPGKAVKEIKIS